MDMYGFQELSLTNWYTLIINKDSHDWGLITKTFEAHYQLIGGWNKSDASVCSG